jgi:predicted nucleotidyltransferase component of viral defense system
MIESGHLVAWKNVVPWADPIQVEQDLVLSRALVELFRQGPISDACTLRGGTALNKLIFQPAARYSEDIDLVQEAAGPIGPILDAVRDAVSPWLGKPKVERLKRGTTVVWKFETNSQPVKTSRLKLEINTREHGWVGVPKKIPFKVENPWYRGEVDVPTLELEVLLATKLRALYQRRKGRDLFDLHASVDRFPALDLARVLSGFRTVMEKEGHPVSWREFEINLNDKVEFPGFKQDIQSLLAEGDFDPAPVWASLAPRLRAAWGSA